MLLFLTLYSILKKRTTVSTKILGGTTAFNIHNNKKCFLSSKSHIKMISVGSCDTEDRSNDAKNSASNSALKLFLLYF